MAGNIKELTSKKESPLMFYIAPFDCVIVVGRLPLASLGLAMLKNNIKMNTVTMMTFKKRA